MGRNGHGLKCLWAEMTRNPPKVGGGYKLLVHYDSFLFEVCCQEDIFNSPSF